MYEDDKPFGNCPPLPLKTHPVSSTPWPGPPRSQQPTTADGTPLRRQTCATDALPYDEKHLEMSAPRSLPTPRECSSAKSACS